MILGHRFQDFDGLGYEDFLFGDAVGLTHLDISLDDIIAKLVKGLHQLDAFPQVAQCPVCKIVIHIEILARPGKDLHVRLLEIDSGLGVTSAADTGLAFRQGLVILLAALSAVAFVTTWFDAAFVKNDIATASAVDTCLPCVVVFSGEIVQQVTQGVVPVRELQHLPPGVLIDVRGLGNMVQFDAVGITGRSVPTVHGVIPKMSLQEGGQDLPTSFVHLFVVHCFYLHKEKLSDSQIGSIAKLN